MAPQPTRMRYNDPTVTLYGQVYTDFFFGRPNYGASPSTDAIEHAIILALDEPICVEGDGQRYDGNYESIAEDYIDRVQIATRDVDALPQLRGHGVKLKGRLWHAHTGHHHTGVLMSVEDVPTVIDDRNAFPDKYLVSSGSGFLLGDGGLIGTAAHIIEDVDYVSVTRGLYRQRASVVAIDPSVDLAILKIEPRGPIADVIRIREKKVRPTRSWMPPRLGERVYAFGFPLRADLPHSLNMTEGRISSEVGIERHQFQISAAIQPGHSGGPVFDEYGNLIGVAVSSLEPAQTLNFCVQGWHFESFCCKFGVRLAGNELCETKLQPTILAEAALHFCVEVEGWSDCTAS